MIMKKILISIFVMFLVFSTGCIKRNNCDCGLTGKFIYFEEEQYFPPDGGISTYVKVNALFISDNESAYPIYGKIPKKYQVMDTIEVNVCVKNIDKRAYTDHLPHYKLTCIEKAE